MPEPLLVTERLTRHFKIGGALSRRTLHAVDDVSITIGEREIVALAGESGSGKSTVARLLARVYRPTAGTIKRSCRRVGPPATIWTTPAANPINVPICQAWS